MFKNTYIRGKLVGTHRTIINNLNEKDLLYVLGLINNEVAPARDKSIPTSDNYRQELNALLSRYRKLRDDVTEKEDPDYIYKLRDLATDLVKFEFKVRAETE